MAHNPKDFNISGYKIVNVADPVNQQDVTTKAYVDEWIWKVHDLNALNNRDEYVRVINTKTITMASLVGICKVTTNFILKQGKFVYDRSDLVHIWLESAICSNSLWLPEQNLKDKYIEVVYKKPVAVKSWELILRFKTPQPIKITYHWELSADGETWFNSPKVWSAINKTEENCGNTNKIIFPCGRREGARFWRIHVNEGTINKEDDHQPWANMLFMNVM